MTERYINAYHHRRPYREFSFNADRYTDWATREEANAEAAHETAIEPFTRRIGIWRVRAKD